MRFNQRLFVTDNASLGPPGFRIMVFDVRPESLAELGRGELPEAIGVLGQPHFETWSPGEGPATIGGGGAGVVDSERQLYFFADSGNNRVLVWDVHPDRFENGMEAKFVIGQPDLTTRQRGLGRDRFCRRGRYRLRRSASASVRIRQRQPAYFGIRCRRRESPPPASRPWP